MRRFIVAVLGSSALALSAGCVKPGLVAAALAGAAKSHEAQSVSSQVYLFGGTNHKTFLGCFCGSVGANSLLNSYSPYGSRFGAQSIFNHVSEFGSQYSAYSPCNRYATDPPVVVSSGGTFLGRLTLNPYSSGAIREPRVLAWLAAVCEG